MILKAIILQQPFQWDDFLQYVMYESSKCDKVVTANLDKLKLKNVERNEVVGNDISEEFLVHTPQCLIPSLEWQNDQINLFNKLRERLEYLRNNYDEEATPKNKRKNVEWSVVNCEKYQPSLSEAIRIRQQKVIGFVYHLVKLFEDLPTDGSSIPHHLGAWMYTALALLPIPLLPDTCSSLRQLARKCIQLRAVLPVENEDINGKVEPLNLFICLVARYFNQVDLADKV
ncbi:gem-associated protein 2 isoform X2 [Chrysoperla carnea]|uniref:gem-associated protein 2 isoform X2 n=1 Tax=Chrysoperla carnea TaxID=189513 RepID=UPI001D076BEF|nr:gem-associated protein 2 isoform X2 [Chrysoperla carnea]